MKEIVCKKCIFMRGLFGLDFKTVLKTQKGFYEHLESVHGICVRRYAETEMEARARFIAEHKGGRHAC